MCPACWGCGAWEGGILIRNKSARRICANSMGTPGMGKEAKERLFKYFASSPGTEVSNAHQHVPIHSTAQRGGGRGSTVLVYNNQHQHFLEKGKELVLQFGHEPFASCSCKYPDGCTPSGRAHTTQPGSQAVRDTAGAIICWGARHHSTDGVTIICCREGVRFGYGALPEGTNTVFVDMVGTPGRLLAPRTTLGGLIVPVADTVIESAMQNPVTEIAVQGPVCTIPLTWSEHW